MNNEDTWSDEYRRVKEEKAGLEDANRKLRAEILKMKTLLNNAKLEDKDYLLTELLRLVKQVDPASLSYRAVGPKNWFNDRKELLGEDQ